MSSAPHITAASYRKDKCHKSPYTSRSKAMAAIQRWEVFDLHAYKCKSCNRWHIGHKSGGNPNLVRLEVRR